MLERTGFHITDISRHWKHTISVAYKAFLVFAGGMEVFYTEKVE